jgi:hypothetical protein
MGKTPVRIVERMDKVMRVEGALLWMTDCMRVTLGMYRVLCRALSWLERRAMQFVHTVAPQSPRTIFTPTSSRNILHKARLLIPPHKKENASGVDAAAPETPPNKPATFSLIGAQHGKGFECVRWLHSNLPGSPTPAIDEPKTTEWIHEAHVDQSAPTSFASNAIGWHAQRPVSESIVCDDPTEDEEYGEDGMLLDAITPTRRAGSTTPTTQWVTMPTFPPVRPVPEPIDDFVQLPAPTPAEARWMARVERRRRVPRNGRRVYRPMGMWRKY